jgi:Ni,Fe-hydrogenase I small subunit
MPEIQDAIKQHNALVRTNSRNRVCYRKACAACGKKEAFAPHELRRRSLRYISENRVLTVVIWLARWRCRACRRSFTDYPDFRLAV